MKKNQTSFLVATLLLVNQYGWCGVQNQYQDGAAYAQGKIQETNNTINDQSAEVSLGTIPNSSSTMESGLYRNGMGMVSEDGLIKQRNCAVNNPNRTNAEKLECEAINFATRNPTQRPRYEVSSDRDTLVVDSHRQIASGNEKSAAHCRVIKRTLRESFQTHVCLEGNAFTEVKCKKVLSLDCNKIQNVFEKSLRSTVDVGPTHTWIDFSNNILDIGLGNRGEHPQGNYQTTFYFNAEKVNFKKFVALDFQVDDHVKIWINDNLFLEKIGWVPHRVAINKDASEFLINGLNRINIHVQNVPKGWTPMIGNIRFGIEFVCVDVWDNQCSGYEAQK